MSVLEMFVVYRHPRDYPERYVLRRWWVSAGVQSPDDDWFYLADTLDQIREYVPAGCVRLERDPKDQPQIVEVWV